MIAVNVLSLLRLNDRFNFRVCETLQVRFSAIHVSNPWVSCTLFRANSASPLRVLLNGALSKHAKSFTRRRAVAVCGYLCKYSQRGRATSPRTAGDLWRKNCSSCHGKDGRAKTLKAKFNHARDLTDGNWQSDVSDERIFNSISRGRGKNMPGYSKKMTEQEIESLVSFVRAMRR